MNIVVTQIPEGRQVDVFKKKAEFAKFVLKAKKKLIFALEDIEIPDNLTAKGLVQFAESIQVQYKDNLITRGSL